MKHLSFFLVVIAFLAFSPPDTVANQDQEIATHQVDVLDLDLDQDFVFVVDQHNLTLADDIGTSHGGYAIIDAEAIVAFRFEYPPNYWQNLNRVVVQTKDKPHSMKTIIHLEPALVFRC